MSDPLSPNVCCLLFSLQVSQSLNFSFMQMSGFLAGKSDTKHDIFFIARCSRPDGRVHWSWRWFFPSQCLGRGTAGGSGRNDRIPVPVPWSSVFSQNEESHPQFTLNTPLYGSKYVFSSPGKAWVLEGLSSSGEGILAFSTIYIYIYICKQINRQNIYK